MTREVELTDAANEEFDAAILWYESEQAGLGVRFVLHMDEVFERIADDPKAFTVWDEDSGVQRATVEVFPFVVLFSALPTKILVVALAHSHPQDRARHPMQAQRRPPRPGSSDRTNWHTSMGGTGDCVKTVNVVDI